MIEVIWILKRSAITKIGKENKDYVHNLVINIVMIQGSFDDDFIVFCSCCIN